MSTAKTIVACCCLAVLSIASTAAAQKPTAEEMTRANNPIADIKTFNLHNYYVPKLLGVDDETANTMWLRWAQPIGRVLVRASLPFPTTPQAGDPESGIGDFNIFGTYLAVQEPEKNLGIGPLLVVPSAAETALGTGKWQAGLAAVAFMVPSPQFQYGGLVTWSASIAGEDDRDDVSVLALQPFGIWQLGGGTYLRSTGIAVFDLRSGNHNVPFGLGIGKITKVKSKVFNIFAEPQFTVLHDGVGQPGLQLFFGLNTQFGG